MFRVKPTIWTWLRGGDAEQAPFHRLWERFWLVLAIIFATWLRRARVETILSCRQRGYSMHIYFVMDLDIRTLEICSSNHVWIACHFISTLHRREKVLLCVKRVKYVMEFTFKVIRPHTSIRSQSSLSGMWWGLIEYWSKLLSMNSLRALCFSQYVSGLYYLPNLFTAFLEIFLFGHIILKMSLHIRLNLMKIFILSVTVIHCSNGASHNMRAPLPIGFHFRWHLEGRTSLSCITGFFRTLRLKSWKMVGKLFFQKLKGCAFMTQKSTN